MSQITQHLGQVRQRIAQAAREAGRPASDIALLAVSKTQPADAILEACSAGQRLFGESYVQEAIAKMQILNTTPAGQDIDWHFIGPIQSNKTSEIARHFGWVHSVDRLKIAQRLSDQRPADLPPLNICLQVNISGEVSKSGARPAEVYELASHIAQLPRLCLRGLMAIPAQSEQPAEQRNAFRQLARLQADLIAHGLTLDTLSMGMSSDLEAAILEGATIVRVGTDIFGARQR
jgi:pyridoxal phosphate enzyme (YggS family)